MAEDSVSFASAFKADHFKTTMNKKRNEVHHYKSKQQVVPAKIFAGKLGDLSIRFGRYKLVRFNAPKDLRTGYNKQHEAGHEGAEWKAAEGTQAQCRYNEDGSKINPDCTVEKQCRSHTVWPIRLGVKHSACEITTISFGTWRKISERRDIATIKNLKIQEKASKSQLCDSEFRVALTRGDSIKTQRLFLSDSILKYREEKKISRQKARISTE